MRTFACFVLMVCLPALGAVPTSTLAQSPDASVPASSRAPGDTVELDVVGAVARALDESPEVDRRRAQQRFAEARSAEARASRFLTDFTLSTAHSFAPGLDIPDDNTRPDSELYLNPDVVNDWTPTALRPFSNVNVVARQPLLTWGELSGNIRAARHAVDLEEARVDQEAVTVAARTGELYYSLLLTKALDRLADRTRSVIDRAKREVQRLLDEGADDVDDADLFQVRLTEEEYERRVVEIKQRRATAQAALNRQLFLPEETHLEPTDDELTPLDFTMHPDSLAYYTDLALRNRAELDQAEAGIKAREALVDVEKSDFYPKLGFQATYGYSFTLPARPRQNNAFVGDGFRGNSTRTGFGIQMNLNVLQTRARVEQAQAELNEVRYQQEAAQQLIRFEVEQAYRDVIVAHTAVQSRDRDVTTTGEWLRTEQINFDLGFGDTENLVKAVRANLEAEARYYEAVHAYNTAVIALLRTTGTLPDRIRGGMLLDPPSGE